MDKNIIEQIAREIAKEVNSNGTAKTNNSFSTSPRKGASAYDYQYKPDCCAATPVAGNKAARFSGKKSAYDIQTRPNEAIDFASKLNRTKCGNRSAYDFQYK